MFGKQNLSLWLFATALTIAKPGLTAKLPEKVIAVPMIRDAAQTGYYAEFQVGTPPQKSYLKVDTGSPNYSFLSSSNAVCAKESQPCAVFGTFDNTTSSTSIYEGPGFNDALIWYGRGDFVNDTFSLGGVRAENMYFGYTSVFGFPERALGDVATILGLSLDCQFAGPQCTNKGPYLLPQLKSASVIDYMATSIYLGPDDRNVSNAQMLLGRACDKAKIDGDLFTLNMVDPHDAQLSSGQTNVVNVTRISVLLDNGTTASTEYGEPTYGYPTLLDTGYTSWDMTETIFNAVFAGLGGSGPLNSANRYQVIDCAYRDPSHPKSYVEVEFGSAGKIKVPLYTLVTKFDDGTCGAFINSRGTTTLTPLGDPFLRGTYAIFDQERFTVSLGQVRHTDEEDMVSFPEDGFKSG